MTDVAHLTLEQIDAETGLRLGEELAGRPVPGLRVSREAFERWALAGEVAAEWVDGEVVLMAPASTEHESLIIWMAHLLSTLNDEFSLGVILQNVMLAMPRSNRVPDLFLVREARREIIKPTRLEGPPDLAVEVVSPSSTRRDRQEKLAEYEAFGIREYLIIDPLAKRAELFRRDDASGKFAEVGTHTDAAFNVDALDGFTFQRDWFWQRPLPKVSTLLAG